MSEDVISWSVGDPKDMTVHIKINGQVVMKISTYEIIESSSRPLILKHIQECDSSYWLKRWQEERADAVVDKLKGQPR